LGQEEKNAVNAVVNSNILFLQPYLTKLSHNVRHCIKRKENLLIAAFEDEQMLGCCMIVEMDPRKARLRQMAVLNNLQGKGIGRALIQFAENLARDHGYRIMSMHARKPTVPFFEKMGYKISGDEFIEITIPHYEMIKEL